MRFISAEISLLFWLFWCIINADNIIGDTDKDDERLQQQINELAEGRETVLYPYAEKMGNCEVVLLGGDHLIYEQKPEECGEIVKTFLDGLDS